MKNSLTAASDKQSPIVWIS